MKPSLLIALNDQDVWYASVANTDLSYLFKVVVEEPTFNFLCVQGFAMGMQADRQSLIEAVRTGMELGEADPADVVAELVDATHTLVLEEELIYTAAAERALSYNLAEAGRVLLDALGDFG